MMKQKIKRNLSCFLSAVMMITTMGMSMVVSAEEFLFRDFSTVQEDGWPVEDADIVSSDLLGRDLRGSSKLNYPSYSTTENALVASMDHHEDAHTYSYGALMYGGMSSDELNLSGNVVFESKMAFDIMDNSLTYWPLAISPVATDGTYGNSKWNGKFSKDGFKIINGKCYVDDNELCDISVDEYYTFKIAVFVDGNAETVDEMFCTVTDSNGNSYTGVATLDHEASGAASMEAIKSLSIIRYNNNCEQTATTYIKTIKGYCVDVLPTVDFSILADAEDIEGGDDITLTFSTDMNTESFKDIVLKVNGTKVSDFSYQATDAKTYVLTLPETLPSGANCKIEVPKTVISADGFGVGDTISFKIKSTSIEPPNDEDGDENEGEDAVEEILISRDFSMAQEDGWPVENSDTISSEGLLRDVHGTSKLNYLSYNEEEGALETTKDSHEDGGTYAYGALMYGISNSGEDILNLKGNVVFESKMKFTNLSATMWPFVFTPAVTVDSFGQARWYGDNFTKDGFKIENGKCYVDDVELLTIQPNEYYTFRVAASIDGNPDTVDQMICTVEDKNGTTYQANARLDSSIAVAEMDSIKSVSIIRYNNDSGNDATTFIKTLKAWIVPSPKFTATVADGDADVELLNEIKITFDRDMDADGFSKIKIYDWNGNVLKTSILPIAGTAKECTITLEEKLLNNRAYKIDVPVINSVDGIATEATEINFTTKPKDTLISIATPVVNEGGALHVTSGSIIGVKSYISNKTASVQEGCVIIGVYNSENRLKKIGYKKQLLAANAENVPVEARVTVPENIGDGAYVRVFGWDSLESMNAGIDMLILQ